MKYEGLGDGSVGDSPPLAPLMKKQVSSNNAVLSICFRGQAVNGDYWGCMNTLERRNNEEA